MKTQHVVAIVIAAVVGVPVAIGATGFIAALLMPSVLSDSDRAKEVAARMEASVAAKEQQLECMEQYDYEYCQEEYDRTMAAFGN